MKPSLLLIVTALLTGCGKSTDPKAPKSESVVQQAIDGATGRTAVRAQRKAEATIRAVSQKEQQDYKEVTGE